MKKEADLAEHVDAAQAQDESLKQREAACMKKEAGLVEQAAAAQAQDESLKQREAACMKKEADLVEHVDAAQAQDESLKQREAACMKLEADLTRSQDKVALQECELHKRAGEVQARHEQMERERVAALQDACAHCVGLVLHNTKTTLRTASDSIAEHCAMSPNQVAEATPGNKYPLLALLTGGSGRVTQLPGITAKTVQAWRDEFLAPGGTLILALLRSGLNLRKQRRGRVQAPGR